MATRKKPCAAMADAIQPKPPFGLVSGPFPYMPIDLSEPLLLLMMRLSDDPADDDGIIWDFAECFGLNRRAVAAAVRAYRHASTTVH